MRAFSTMGFSRHRVAQLRQALSLKPDSTEALNNLAWLQATSADDSLRNGAEAVRLAERACQLTSNKQPVMLGTMAAAYAEAGRFPEAIATAQKANELAIAAGNTQFAQMNRLLLENYKQSKPWHENGASRQAR